MPFLFFFFFTSEQSYFVLSAREVNSSPHKVFFKQQIVYWVFFSHQLSFSVKSCIMENDPFSWLVMHSFKHSKMNLIKKLSDMPKMKKALFCLSRLGFQIRGGWGDINDLFQEAKASKWLWASCPTAYMFNDAHQNLAFHYLNIKLELHEHSPWLLRIMFKHATKHRRVDSKRRPQRQCQGTTFHVLPLGNWYRFYILSEITQP